MAHAANEPTGDTNAEVVDDRRTRTTRTGAPTTDHTRAATAPATTEVYDDAPARERFGGTNWGACFFGWLVAIALSILLTSIVGAIVAAVGDSTDVTQTEAQRQAGTIGVVAAIVLVVVLTIGDWAGGYVAGRMSRFDGGRQGVGVWLIGLLVTVVAIALGAIFGSQYNILDRVSLPNLPISTDQIGSGAIVTAVVVVVITLLAALLGGKAGHRYHDRVDRAATRETREVERPV